MFIIKFGIILLIIILLIVFIKQRIINTKIIKDKFKNISIAVVGPRGSGKDSLMSWIAYGQEHNSNVPLQENTNLINLKDIMVKNVYRESLINGYKFNYDFKNYEIFNNITFISDASIYFPNYDDGKLKKDYPNLAITIAIWRHLYDGPIHFNCQNFNRLWKILREQIEDTIKMNGIRFKGPYAILDLTYYEKSEDAENGQKPIKLKLFGKQDLQKLELTKHGIIKDYRLIIPKRKINHDSRYFKKIIFKEEIKENE